MVISGRQALSPPTVSGSNDYIDEDRFAQTLQRIFEYVTRRQNHHGITIASSDSDPA